MAEHFLAMAPTGSIHLLRGVNNAPGMRAAMAGWKIEKVTDAELDEAGLGDAAMLAAQEAAQDRHRGSASASRSPSSRGSKRTAKTAPAYNGTNIWAGGVGMTARR
jgi:hypothetical protein